MQSCTFQTEFTNPNVKAQGTPKADEKKVISEKRVAKGMSIPKSTVTRARVRRSTHGSILVLPS